MFADKGNLKFQHQPQLNKQIFENKRKIRSKIAKIFNNENLVHCDGFINKLDTFNKKIAMSIEFNIAREVKKSKNFRFEKYSEVENLCKNYVNTDNVLSNQIHPEELLKKKLNPKELDQLKNDIDYFIKDQKIKGILDFCKSKTLVERITEEEVIDNNKGIKLNSNKKRRTLIKEQTSPLENKLQLELVNKTNNKLESKDIIPYHNQNENNIESYSKNRLNHFQMKVKEFNQNLMNSINLEREKVKLIKQNEKHFLKIPQKLLMNMTENLHNITKIKNNLNKINSEQNSIILNSTREGQLNIHNTQTNNLYSNFIGTSNTTYKQIYPDTKTEPTISTSYINTAGSSKQSPTKFNLILNTKERNKRISTRLDTFKFNSKFRISDELLLKTRVSNIKDNLMITNLQNNHIKSRYGTVRHLKN